MRIAPVKNQRKEKDGKLITQSIVESFILEF